MGKRRVSHGQEFLDWLADRIVAATDVLDDIQGCQLFYESRDETRRDVVREALINLIAADVKRLREEMRKAAVPAVA
jgi:hypothetical protein